MLIIDEEFERLFIPGDVELLNNNIMTNTVDFSEQIVEWHNIIISGLTQYKMCEYANYPISVKHLDFIDRNDAISWICQNELVNHKTVESNRKYLVGKRYNAERLILVGEEIGRTSASALGRTYGICHATIIKYGRYATAIDKVYEKLPELAYMIRYGKVKVSIDNAIELQYLDEIRLQQVYQEAQDESETGMHIKKAQLNGRKLPRRKRMSKVAPLPVTVKNMPVYDPDAELLSLSLTMPSWISSVDRAIKQSDLQEASSEAKSTLYARLLELRDKANSTLKLLRGEINE